MANPVSQILKKTYGVLLRYPSVVRLREAFRQRIQLRYWPWYRLPPRRPGTDPAARSYFVLLAIHFLLLEFLKANKHRPLLQGSIFAASKDRLFPRVVCRPWAFGRSPFGLT